MPVSVFAGKAVPTVGVVCERKIWVSETWNLYYSWVSSVRGSYLCTYVSLLSVMFYLL